MKKYKKVERKTYIEGNFKGKFIGYYDPYKSDINHELFYDLEIISGEVFVDKSKKGIRHWEKGEAVRFKEEEIFLSKMPEKVTLVLKSGNDIKNYSVRLHDAKLSDYKLLNQVHENDRVFGDVEGDLSAFLLHYDKVELPPEEIKEEPVFIRDTNTNPIGIKSIKAFSDRPKESVVGLKNNNKWGTYKSGSGYSNAYGNLGNHRTKSNDISFWDVVSGVLSVLFFGFILFNLLLATWQILVPIGVIVLFIYLFAGFKSIVVWVLSLFLRVLGLALSIGFIFGILYLFTDTLSDHVIPIPENPPKEEVQEQIPDPIINGDIISHNRIWEDYYKNQYETNLKVRVDDLDLANSNRNNLDVKLNSRFSYDRLVDELYKFDKATLDLTYTELDSLQSKYDLNRLGFAQALVSLVQNIPYTLILDQDCNADLYNNQFITQYLSNGKPCRGNEKFGILSPAEFIGSLNGDCDTRTLLLFTILNHYDYDVAMLSSERYGHSILGINLPFKGLYKRINGKKYVIWETTSNGMPPGVLSQEMSDMRFWKPSLVSSKN